ncbi:ATP-binding protein [Roseateles sp. P5_E7]
MVASLADFIDSNLESILSDWENFAGTLTPAAAGLDQAALRDHAVQILHAVAQDLRTQQSFSEQIAKSRGEAIQALLRPETAAETHGFLRATSGFTLKQLVAEYRSLRATVLRLWSEVHVPGVDTINDITRFNEAIDQAIAESVQFFASETERWRSVFLGVLGHDLRGPLNAILLTSQLVSRLNDGTPTSKLAERLINGGERMKHLLDDLLDFSKASLGIGIPVLPANTNLARVCEEEIELQRAAWPAHTIELEQQGETQGLWDADRLKQVIGNLVSNAAKYGAAGAPIRVGLLGNETDVVLCVENEGSIAEGSMDVLFEPLRREAHSELPDAERASLGLGLFIVRHIATAHGGTVSVASSAGRTVFSVTLPRQRV